MVFTVHRIVISNSFISYVMSAYSMGRGWQSGSKSGVLFIPNKPAALLMAKTSPLGTVLFCMALMVSGMLTRTIACAMAVLSVVLLSVISIMVLIVGYSMMGNITRNLFSKNHSLIVPKINS